MVQQMADRYERIAVDADGVLDPLDVKMIADIRKQVDAVLTHPTTKAIKKAGV
jgi:hypothetical protein